MRIRRVCVDSSRACVAIVVLRHGTERVVRCVVRLLEDFALHIAGRARFGAATATAATAAAAAAFGAVGIQRSVGRLRFHALGGVVDRSFGVGRRRHRRACSTGRGHCERGRACERRAIVVAAGVGVAFAAAASFTAFAAFTAATTPALGIAGIARNRGCGSAFVRHAARRAFVARAFSCAFATRVDALAFAARAAIATRGALFAALTSLSAALGPLAALSAFAAFRPLAALRALGALAAFRSITSFGALTALRAFRPFGAFAALRSITTLRSITALAASVTLTTRPAITAATTFAAFATPAIAPITTIASSAALTAFAVRFGLRSSSGLCRRQRGLRGHLGRRDRFAAGTAAEHAPHPAEEAAAGLGHCHR